MPAGGENLRREINADRVCIVTFDRRGSSANIFDRVTIEELRGAVDFIESADSLRGVVFCSAKKSIFVAGADLKEIASLPATDLRAYIAEGQSVFNRIAALKIPAVAAIHGAALGGGLEVALACDHRVCTDESVTKLGLPEVTLGLVPAWGGCTRLPRIVDPAVALDFIVSGKVVGARAALEVKLVDEVVSRAALLEAAERLIAKGKSPARSASKIEPAPVGKIREKMDRNYPALTAAFEIVVAMLPEKESLARELDAIVELAGSESTRNLLRLFFARERAKKLRIHNAPPGLLPGKVAVVGAGTMGSGIAYALSKRGVDVLLRDVDQPRVDAGIERVKEMFAADVKRGALSESKVGEAIGRITPITRARDLGEADFIVEAATEKLEIKQQIFAELDAIAKPDAILATNTSALSISEIAGATKKPERVVGIHFFNPVNRMQLVEVVPGAATEDSVVQRALEFAQTLGKLPVLVKDRPGFIVNRVLFPYLLAAVQSFEKGETLENIDGAMRAFGMPMGPLRLIDEIGLDIVADIAATLARAFPERARVPALIAAMLKRGSLGKKSGAGFYNYADAQPVKIAARESVELQTRLLRPMITEAKMCADEKIASADDIDFAMVIGTGFPSFRGGPLACAATLGT